MRADRWATVIAAALAGACGGSDKPPPSPSGSFTLSGTVTYDSVPATGAGLDYLYTVEKPVRGAGVEVVTGNPAATLGSGTTGPLGEYSITWTGTSAVAVRVRAQTLSPPMRVQDNTTQPEPALYVLDSGPVDASATTNLNLRARSGWTGSSYGAPRAAAPFAILDAMVSAAAAFSAVRSPAFPELRLNWSVNNRPQGGSISAGYIGTSHYNPATQQLYVLGQADVDTDEYDTHVVVHEWGHYFEDRLSRADSPGGPHASGQQKDPRLAFSEGWGNALGAIALYPDDVYADTMGAGQAGGFWFPLEANAADDPVPGWWSEMSVAYFLYDLFDPTSVPDGDALEVGLGPIYDVMVADQRTTPAFTTLFSFVDAMKRARPGEASTIDAMLSGRGVASPVQDAWGKDEAHAAWAPSLPVYRSLAVGGASTAVSFYAGYEPNNLHQNRFLRFTGTGGTVTVRAGSAAVDVSLEVWRAGQLLRYVDAYLHGEEVAPSIPTVAGDDYLVLVTGWEMTGSLYSVPVSVTSP